MSTSPFYGSSKVTYKCSVAFLREYTSVYVGVCVCVCVCVREREREIEADGEKERKERVGVLGYGLAGTHMCDQRQQTLQRNHGDITGQGFKNLYYFALLTESQ